MSVGGGIVQIVTGLGSGVVGSLIGAHAQRWQYKQQRREENRRLLWQYEQVLADEGDYLTHDTYFPGTKGFRRHEDGELDRARSRAYAAIQELPAELRDDLIKDHPPEYDTFFDLGDHFEWLARRLREHLRATETRSAAIRRTLRRWSEHLHVVGRSSHRKQDRAA